MFCQGTLETLATYGFKSILGHDSMIMIKWQKRSNGNIFQYQTWSKFLCYLFVCFTSTCSGWVCRRQYVMFSLSGWLTISWWRARLASLWRGTGALESTSKWPKHTKEGLVVCVETIMMTDQMISAAAAVRQTSLDTHLSSQSAANSGQLYQSWAELHTPSEHTWPGPVFSI